MENLRLNNNISKEAIKIKPIELYTKIQEANPAHYSNLVNKDLGYDAMIQLGDGNESYKLCKCISSARPNSELFKRFSKNFLYNLKNDIDQLFFFTSQNLLSRLETSIGLQTNPGIFLIVGLTFLDEKYKEQYHKSDIEFSFLQFKEGQMYDLLSYTQQPLILQREDTDENYVNFKEHWVKTTTFNQFIQLFKIALFNNKDRDFKSQNTSIKCHSTFIMKVKRKLYNLDNQLIKEHQSVLIDFQQNCSKQNSLNGKQKTASKTPLDYILIQMHNSNPNNKPIHYHLVAENHLLLMIKKFLKKNQTKQKEENQQERKQQQYVGGHITIINSFPADKAAFPKNYAYLQNIIQNLGESWQAKVLPKDRIQTKFNFKYVQNQLQSILQGLQNNTYSSLRNFNSFKQQLIVQIKKFRQEAKQFGKIIQAYMRQKSQLRFLQNQYIAYGKRYIGGCIKSDHFKDFYKAKSYLQLEREITIKTENIREDIYKKNHAIEVFQKKYLVLKKKWRENYQKHQAKNKTQIVTEPTTFLQNTNSYNPFNSLNQMGKGGSLNEYKFKKISEVKTQTNQLEQIRLLINYLYEYLHSLWNRVNLSDERTITNSIQFQQMIASDQGKISEQIKKFVQEISSISETDIMYQQENNIYNNNRLALFRSLNYLGMISSKKTVKGLEIGKRMLVNVQPNFQKKQQKKSKITKLPSISTQNIVITGDLRISQLLTNPNDQTLLKNRSQFRQ